MVPESSRQVAEDGKDLGSEQHNGGVWFIWRYGQTFTSSARNHSEKCQGRGDEFLRSLASQLVTRQVTNLRQINSSRPIDPGRKKCVFT